MEKLDLRKQYKDLYAPSSKVFSMVEVPTLQYLMIDGQGDPNTSPLYADAVQTLYGLSYTLKFHLKQTFGTDYTVMGLESLWWTPDMAEFSMEQKEKWHWTAMILQPDFITAELLLEAKTHAVLKGKAPLAELTRLETCHEGLCVQILYFGAYADEGPTLARMHAYIHANGMTLNGKHHEIYLSDPRRVAPENCKTILRQPVCKD